MNPFLDSSLYTFIIIGFTVVISLIGFSNQAFFDKFAFWPYGIKRNNEWYRFISGGFLHADWMHLLLNMFVLYSFGSNLEVTYSAIFGVSGKLIYVMLYISAIAVAHILTYVNHRENSMYRSIGASGAVAAILFASIFLQPGGKVYVYGIPLNSLLFGVLYLATEYYMGRRGKGNVNHDAHFMGALYGFVFLIFFHPSYFLDFVDAVKAMF